MTLTIWILELNLSPHSFKKEILLSLRKKLPTNKNSSSERKTIKTKPRMKQSNSVAKLWNHRKLMLSDNLKPVRQSKMYKYGWETEKNGNNKNKYNTRKINLFENNDNLYDITNKNMTPKVEIDNTRKKILEVKQINQKQGSDK